MKGEPHIWRIWLKRNPTNRLLLVGEPKIFRRKPGPYKVGNKILIIGGTALTQPLTSALAILFIQIKETRKIPKQRLELDKIILYKEGERKDLNDNKPIKVASNIGKIYIEIRSEKIFNKLDFNQSRE